MYNYIQNTEFYTLDEKLGDGYDVSETGSLEDFNSGKAVELNESQIYFRLENPKATTLEVFNTSLTPATIPTIQEIRARVISKIVAFDQSPAVNSFIINGARMWLDSNTRASLLATINAYKAREIPSITLWTTTESPIAVTLSVAQLEALQSLL